MRPIDKDLKVAMKQWQQKLRNRGPEEKKTNKKLRNRGSQRECGEVADQSV